MMDDVRRSRNDEYIVIGTLYRIDMGSGTFTGTYFYTNDQKIRWHDSKVNLQ
jgi:hypothetical protein